MGLPFTIAAGPRQRSHSQVRVPRYSWPHFTISDSRFPQPGGPGLRIYISRRNRVTQLYPQALGSFSSPPTTRNATVEVLDPTSTRDYSSHFSSDPICLIGARGSVLGWGTMLQAEISPVRVPDEVDFLNLPNPSSHTMAPGSTQPLTQMSTRNLPGGNKRQARRADSLAAICEPNVWECGSLNVSQPQGPSRPVQEKLYLLPICLVQAACPSFSIIWLIITKAYRNN
jgi:hypothetical protein